MKRFGLIGKTLGHSFSKLYFDKFFVENNLKNCCYELYELPDISQLPQFLEKNPELEGFNVTIPYKQSIIPFLNLLDPIAEAVGAVNCVTVKHLPNNQILLHGYNTDVIGFEDTLFEGIDAAARQYDKALILGTGGAAAAVAYVLQKRGIEFQFVSRHQNIDSFAFPNPKHLLTYQDLTEEIVREHQLIVNCTPVGMYPKGGGLPALPYNGITEQHYLYDLIYNPPVTRFMEEGQRRGARTRNGLQMLHAQAAAGSIIFNLITNSN